MTGDKRKFLLLNEHGKGNESFGNEAEIPIKGKVTIILDKRSKA